MKQAIICIVQNSEKETLFVKRSEDKEFLPGIWALPTGMVREKEKPEDSVKRGLKEEFDIKIKESILLEKVVESETGRGMIKKYVFLVKTRSNKKDLCFDSSEVNSIVFMTFEEFYSRFANQEIGFILRYLKDKYSKFNLA